MPTISASATPLRSTPIPASSELTAYERSLADAPPVRPTVRRRRRRVSLVGVLFTALVLVGPVLGISLATWGFITAHHAQTESRELNDPNLSDADRSALNLPESVTTLFGAGAAAAVTSAFEADLGPATRFTQISLYSDYAVAVVQDGGLPAHLDQFPWRSGRVGTSSPRPNTADTATMVFTLDQVDWSAVARLADSAVELTGVEGGAVTYAIVDRSTSDPSLPITIRIYVSGPRGSGFVEATAAGDVTAVY